tara:strand:- start:3390 stop:4244 length:855 start_codon:yes stop_codon:yes gene_type:complete
MTKKIIILGAKGFVGSSVLNKLNKQKETLVPLSRDNFDFLSYDFVEFMKSKVHSGDVIINAAAIAPCKNFDQLNVNAQLIINIQKSISDIPNLRIINISSDAVYPDVDGDISEETDSQPLSLHGLMHDFREKLISLTHSNLLNIRPTLIYGYGDPHGGYGPNLFIKKLLKNENISLFGKGEEKRDHIYIDNLVEIITACIDNNLVGNLNAVTGEVKSFYDIAKIIKETSKNKIQINYIERNGPIPHNGLRTFDNSKLLKNIPQIKFDPIEKNIEKILFKYKNEK